MRVPHPLPYQGSKRNLAGFITGYLPQFVERLIEPFAGSAAISLAAASNRQAQRFVLNDVNAALMKLWRSILHDPHALSQAYTELWYAQQGREREYYVQVRDQFNHSHQPHLLLYLLARCVKAAVRYNTQGAFNQSPDHRRKGAHPLTMHRHLVGAAALLSHSATLHAEDYRIVLQQATPSDVVYMDPPYAGVCGKRDRRYLQQFDVTDFIEALDDLNQRAIPYIISYDGRSGAKAFGNPLPTTLGLTHIEIAAGRSTQATLLGRAVETYESLYLSPALVGRLSTGQTHQIGSKGSMNGNRYGS